MQFMSKTVSDTVGFRLGYQYSVDKALAKLVTRATEGLFSQVPEGLYMQDFQLSHTATFVPDSGDSGHILLTVVATVFAVSATAPE